VRQSGCGIYHLNTFRVVYSHNEIIWYYSCTTFRVLWEHMYQTSFLSYFVDHIYTHVNKCAGQGAVNLRFFRLVTNCANNHDSLNDGSFRFERV